MSRLAAVFVLGLFAVPALADDWPQWMGPQRDNVWRETGLVDKFPEGGPQVVWRTPVAHGYAGPAVADGRVYVFDFVTSDDVNVDNFGRAPKTGAERIQCLDQATGDEVWTYDYPATYAISYPNGPRCTPLIAGGKLYTLGAEGNLHCFDAATGDIVWSKDFKAEYGAETPLWGFSAHPLVDGDKLICVVGGPGSHAVAFNKDTGEEIWKALTSEEQGYSPPTIIEFGGVRQLVLLRPDAVTAVDPETGGELWSLPYRADNGCVIMSPVLSGEYLFVGSHQNKSLLLKLTASPPGAEEVWHDKGRDAISPINVQPFAEDGVLYGVDQRGMLRAIDLAEGKQLWETPQPTGDRPLPSGTAFLVRQGNRHWFFTEAGELVIARLSPDGYEEIDRAKVIEPTAAANGRDVLWSMPAFAGRRAYIRNDEEIIAVDLAAPSGPAASQ
jgi:outer membrane protein assembly factor BamB